MLMLTLVVLISFVLWCNLFVANTMTAEEMRQDFITGQCVIGIICANIFYAFAWALKGIKKFVK